MKRSSALKDMEKACDGWVGVGSCVRGWMHTSSPLMLMPSYLQCEERVRLTFSHLFSSCSVVVGCFFLHASSVEEGGRDETYCTHVCCLHLNILLPPAPSGFAIVCLLVCILCLMQVVIKRKACKQLLVHSAGSLAYKSCTTSGDGGGCAKSVIPFLSLSLPPFTAGTSPQESPLPHSLHTRTFEFHRN